MTTDQIETEAERLIDEFHTMLFIDRKQATQCAIIHCNELLKAIDWHSFETPNEEIEKYEQIKTHLLTKLK
jgi:hypothetical protein